jgi:predicted ATPase
MLSEGTRRITAILALLQHKAPPSLLCIEEIENGLDPWSVVTVLKELRSASRRGVQVIVTTHSPWLLDHVDVEDILQVKREEGETVYTKFSDRGDVQAYMGRVPPGAIYVTEG